MEDQKSYHVQRYRLIGSAVKKDALRLHKVWRDAACPPFVEGKGDAWMVANALYYLRYKRGKPASYIAALYDVSEYRITSYVLSFPWHPARISFKVSQE